MPFLSDGTDISRMTCDQIEAAQRRLSPRFPSYEEAQERLHQRREEIVARGCGLIMLIAIVVWICYGGLAPMLVAGAGLLGFIATCFYAGNRQYNRMRDHKREV